MALLLSSISLRAFALPQYQRLVRKEYGFKAPCATCHTQGGGSSLTPYGKAFDRAGKSSLSIQKIAALSSPGDKLSFGEKLKARANPNDPRSTPASPGDWAGQSDIPVQELKSFSPPEISNFTVLEGELNKEQIEKLKGRLGVHYQEEDRYPTFYFGEVDGKKKYVIQYIPVKKLEKAVGLVVSTAGEVVSLAYVGGKKSELSQDIKAKLKGATLASLEKDPGEASEEFKQVRSGVMRGLHGISLVFGKK